MADSQLRIKLLDTARSFILEKGYAATSINEICQAARVTKGAFFHYFTSKEELGKAVLYHHWEPLKHLLEETAPFLQISDPLERVRAHCEFIVNLHDHPDTAPSCLFGNFAQELPATNPTLCGLCDEAFSWWTNIIKVDLDKAVQLYPPKTPINTQSVAEHFVVVYEGALILAKAQRNSGVIRVHLEQFIQYINLLFN